MNPDPSAHEPDETVEDARGLLCPLPVIRLGERVRHLAPGATITLWADDPMAEDDVRQWCRGHGHTLVAVEAADSHIRIRVKTRA